MTVGNGLQGAGSFLKDLIGSPNNVISDARRDMMRMNNTDSGVRGANATGTSMVRRNVTKLNVQDVVDNMLKKPTFGFEGYNPKATVKDLLPVNTHVRAKSKRRMFCEEASRAKDKVPAADKYQSAIDWNKDPESRNIHFAKSARDVIADEIIKRSKNPAKTSPGPAGYDHYDNWKKQQKKAHGEYKPKDTRITFVQEREWNAVQSPGLKYPSINLVSNLSVCLSVVTIVETTLL